MASMIPTGKLYRTTTQQQVHFAKIPGCSGHFLTGSDHYIPGVFHENESRI